MKPDELQFLKLMQQKGKCPLLRKHGLMPRELLPESGLPAKRMWYLLDKWADKDWYEYGTTLDLGWMTPKGMLIT